MRHIAATVLLPVLIALAGVVWPIGGTQWAETPEFKPMAGAGASRPFIIGADISWVQQREDEGRRFSDHGVQKDIFVVLKEHGFN